MIRRLLAVALLGCGLLTVPLARADMTALDALPVHPGESMDGYARSQFGPPWTDDNDDELGHNHCDTRDDILARDLTDVVFKGRCTVTAGVLHDPYTGRVIQFRRGPATSTQIQIDHVVPLADAWRTGAQHLTAQQRTDLANDPRNLLAVEGHANTVKSDQDASQWLPPNEAFHCAYVEKQIAVKATYRLWVTPDEKNAMRKVLSSCKNV